MYLCSSQLVEMRDRLSQYALALWGLVVWNLVLRSYGFNAAIGVEDCGQASEGVHSDRAAVPTRGVI